MPDPTKPRIVIGADHAGYHAKENIKKYLEQAGYAVDDVGTWSEESVDYPDFARAVSERVISGQDQLGILACATGIGMSIAANKVPGIRAALAHDAMTARLAREHNDANVLAIGGREGYRDRSRLFERTVRRRAPPAAHRRDCRTRPGAGAAQARRLTA